MPLPFAIQALLVGAGGFLTGQQIAEGKRREEDRQRQAEFDRSVALLAVQAAQKGDVEAVEGFLGHKGVQKFVKDPNLLRMTAQQVRGGAVGAVEQQFGGLTGVPSPERALAESTGAPTLRLTPGFQEVPSAETLPPEVPAGPRRPELPPVTLETTARPTPRRAEPTPALPPERAERELPPPGQVSVTARGATQTVPAAQAGSLLNRIRAERRPGETVNIDLPGFRLTVADPSAEDFRVTIKTIQVGNENVTFQVMGIDQTGAAVLREIVRGPRGENVQAQTQVAKLYAELDAAVRLPEGDPRRSLIPVYEAAIAEQATSTQSIIETRPDGTVSITRGDPRQVATIASRTRFEATIASVQGVKGTISRLRQVTSPQTLGATGYLSGLVHGTLAQVDAFTGLIRNWIQGVEMELGSISDRSNPINASKWFLDPNLPRSQLLANLLAYELAKAVDTDGRISDKDFELQRDKVLQAGPLSSYQAVLNALDEVERFVNRKEQIAREGLSKIPAGVQPFRHPLSPQQAPTAPTAPPTQQRTLEERLEEKLRAGKTEDEALTELAQEGF